MAIAFDNSVDGSYTSGTSQTTALTVGAGANRKLFVGAIGAVGDIITGATYNGVAMTLIVKQQNPDAVDYNYLFYLDDPASGTHDIVVTASGSASISTIAAAYSGAAAGAPSVFSSVQGSSTVSLALTPDVANSWIIAHGDEHAVGTPAIADALVTGYRSGTTYHQLGDTGAISGTPSTTVGFSNGQSFGMTAASFGPAGGGGGGPTEATIFNAKNPRRPAPFKPMGDALRTNLYKGWR